MFTIFKEEKVITTGILVFLGLSILVRLLLAGFYHTMIKETDNMATTNNRLLKQCKVKFANCYQLMVEYQTFRCLWTSSSTGWRLDTYPLMPGIICLANACCFPLFLPVSGSARGSWAEGCWGKSCLFI